MKAKVIIFTDKVESQEMEINNYETAKRLANAINNSCRDNVTAVALRTV